MRPLWKDILIAVWLGMIIPGIMLHTFVLLDRNPKEELIMEIPVETESTDCTSISVRMADGVMKHMDLDSYLIGVLLAEMPAEFHEEALKAQSVAARTYGWKAHISGGKHADGSVCIDSTCCQGYLSPEDYLSMGGTQENLEKVRIAVKSASPFVLSYGGELIEATYFSSAGGSTEAAVSVWGADFPYLQAVSSPEDILRNRIRFSKADFEKRLGISLSDNPDEWFQSVSYTQGGGVAAMDICTVTFTGVQLRSLLDLPSTAFEAKASEEEIVFITKGYGHRVGMSQHGADTLAKSGYSWQEILQHYYPETTLHPAY